MQLKRPVVFLILLALFFVSLATRTATRDSLESPYFKGGSAMVYTHALNASEGTPLDTISIKANHPVGYTPARYRADGFETAWAAAFRGARFISEVDGRDFARRTVMFLGALCVFTMYALARRLWNSQAAGLLAAFLVAFLAPFVLGTNGRVFTHTTMAPFFLSAHAVLMLSALGASSRRSRILRAIGAAAAAFVLAVSWEPGRYVLAMWAVSLALTMRQDDSRRERALLVSGQALALVVACVVSPHLLATRALGSWPMVLTAAAAIAVLIKTRLHAAALVLGAAAALWVVMIPVRAGATEQFPAFSYLVARTRYLFGGPESPAGLSDWMRHVWSSDHAPLPPHIAIEWLLPLVLLGAAFVLNAGLRARRGLFFGTLAVALIAAIAALVDRSALPVATLALAAVFSGAALSLAKSTRMRVPLVVAGAVVALSSVVFRGGAVDASYQVAKAAGVANRDPSAFLWVSFENTDRELVRFIATRTSVRESVLAPDDLSALLLAFTGRTVVALPGSTSQQTAERSVALKRALYDSEETLFEACRAQEIDYVVYSIDVLLGTGRYSPRHLAGVQTIDPASIAYKMHFDPESLQRFTLLYENDHYRLFQVTGTPQPIFATDHPPFYQTDLLAKSNRDVEAFRKLAVEVMLTYAEGIKARARGNAEGARRRLEWCLLQAPRYSQARIALADALMDLDRYEDARRVVLGLVEYAPDNTRALYYAAFISKQLGKPEDAKGYLALLLSIERDPALIERARALQTAVEQDLPLRPGAPDSP